VAPVVPSFNCTFSPGTSFNSKDGLTQHCKGKKHIENVYPSGKRKESDAALSLAEDIVQRQKLSSDDANPVRGGFAEEVKISTFHESFIELKITWRMYFSGSLGTFEDDRKRY
jgi:hypothetical protein